MTKKQTKNAFEDNLKELEALVTQLEKGDLPLEDSLKAFETGVKLTRECQQALKEAEQKVTLLLEKDGSMIETPFELDS